MDILKLGTVVLTSVILINSIPALNKDISSLITFSACIVVLLYTVDLMMPGVEYIKNMIDRFEQDGFDVVVKAVGIGLITQFVSDIATDSGNKSLANQMILAGRISILLLAIPTFTQIFKIIEQLIY